MRYATGSMIPKGHDPCDSSGFRLRGIAMSRIDGFSDVVFGFAITLLVVSLEVPKTYVEFHQTLRGFFPFALSFTLLLMVWFAHFRLFRRYGLHDTATICVNAVLLFVVLFFVYPLKFVFYIWLGGQDNSNVFTEDSQVREMMALYGYGFAAVYFLIATLYWIGWRHREDLELNALERVLTIGWIVDASLVACVGLVSVLNSRFLPGEKIGLAGFAFFLIGPVKTVHGMIWGRKARLARAEMDRVERAVLDQHRHPQIH